MASLDSPLAINYRETQPDEMDRILSLASDNWLYNLKGRFPYFQGTYPDGAPAQAWKAYQSFAEDVIEHLENDRMTVVLHDFLDNVYQNTSRRFSESWVRSTYLKHYLCNDPVQIQFIAIVRTQSQHRDMPLLEKVEYINEAVRDWKERAFALENVFKDPDANWLFRSGHALKFASEAEAEDLVRREAECPICADRFEAEERNRKNPLRGPCRHYHCQECFNHWLDQTCHGQWQANPKRSFRCPQCRACLCCGQNDCDFHVLDHEERAPPVSLTSLMNRFLGPAPVVGDGADGSAAPAEHSLRGFSAEQFHALREVTRKRRAELAWLNVILSENGLEDGNLREYYEGERQAKFELIEGIIREFEEEPMGYRI